MMQRAAREDVNNFLGYKVEMRSVSKKGRILLAMYGPAADVKEKSHIPSDW